MDLETPKARVIENLAALFAQNEIPVEEYERLTEYVSRAEGKGELAIIEKVVDEYTRRSQAPVESAAEKYPAVPAGDPSRTSLTILSSRVIPGKELSVGPSRHISVLGSSTINIEEGDLGPGRTHLHIVSVLGETVIRIPPGVSVVSTAIPVAGGVWIDHRGEGKGEGETPVLVITGAAVLGNITVKVSGGAF
jgi:hypothetical protein